MRFASLTIAVALIITGWFTTPVFAQLPQIPVLPSPGELLRPNLEAPRVSRCIRIDGRCVFEIARTKSQFNDIEQRLRDISRTYFQDDNAELNIYGENAQIKASVGYLNDFSLMSLTEADAEDFESPQARAQELAQTLEEALEQAKQERQPRVLARRGEIAAGTAAVMLLGTLAISRWKRKSKRSKERLVPTDSSRISQPVSTQLTKQQQWNAKEIQHRLFQLAEAGIIGGGSLFILGLFPQTRILQVFIINVLRIPLRVGLVGLVTYVLIRLSYIAIDRLTAALGSNYLLTPEANRRLQLRVSTISGVTKGIVTLVWVGIGILIALSAIGINIAPLLASAGIIGVAVSFASQNLIKDALNGFFIILEDQYAVGDVINVGDVGGLVENINLRITQLRDAEGRLITIPNSEIKIVANLSNNWSRADINIPIAYQADVDTALKLVTQVAEEMFTEQIWREKILEFPQILGVEDFGDRGLVLRVWIKTQPLKQWEVSREFRRRIKVLFDQEGMPISMQQQEVWFNPSLSKNLLTNGKNKHSQS